MTVQSYSRAQWHAARELFTKPLSGLLLSKFVSLFYVFLLSQVAYAQTFSDLEEKLSLHPQLQSLVHQRDEHIELSIAALGLPDPVISLGVNNFPFVNPSFSEFIPTNKSIGVSQTVPNIAGRKARSNVAAAQGEELALERQRHFALLRAQLITLLLERDRIIKQTQLANEQEHRYQDLLNSSASEVGAGRSMVFRLAEIERERAEVSTQKLELNSELEIVKAKLVYLLGQVPITDPPTISQPLLWSGDNDEFYSVALAKIRVGTYTHKVGEAKAAWKPQWGAQLRYQQREAGANFAGDDFVSAMVTLTVPFWSKRNQQPRLRAAESGLGAAKSRHQERIRQAKATYFSLRSNYQAAEKTAQILNEKINAVINEINAQQVSYESGVNLYSGVIEGQIILTKLKSDLVKERARKDIISTQIDALFVRGAQTNTLGGGQ